MPNTEVSHWLVTAATRRVKGTANLTSTHHKAHAQSRVDMRRTDCSLLHAVFEAMWGSCHACATRPGPSAEDREAHRNGQLPHKQEDEAYGTWPLLRCGFRRNTAPLPHQSHTPTTTTPPKSARNPGSKYRGSRHRKLECGGGNKVRSTGSELFARTNPCNACATPSPKRYTFHMMPAGDYFAPDGHMGRWLRGGGPKTCRRMRFRSRPRLR